VHYDSRPLGHAKLDTTALYTCCVATKTIPEVVSPLDHLVKNLQGSRAARLTRGARVAPNARSLSEKYV
jgi:hypothetical protein